MIFDYSHFLESSFLDYSHRCQSFQRNQSKRQALRNTVSKVYRQFISWYHALQKIDIKEKPERSIMAERTHTSGEVRDEVGRTWKSGEGDTEESKEYETKAWRNKVEIERSWRRLILSTSLLFWKMNIFVSVTCQYWSKLYCHPHANIFKKFVFCFVFEAEISYPRRNNLSCSNVSKR